MHRSAAILLAFLISCPFLLKTGILGWYLLNRTEIAVTLCINRNRPEKRCRGKCYLAKQLKKADRDDHAPLAPAKVREKAEISPYLPAEPSPFAGTTTNEPAEGRSGFRPPAFPAQSVLRPVFKPPA